MQCDLGLQKTKQQNTAPGSSLRLRMPRLCIQLRIDFYDRAGTNAAARQPPVRSAAPRRAASHPPTLLSRFQCNREQTNPPPVPTPPAVYCSFAQLRCNCWGCCRCCPQAREGRKRRIFHSSSDCTDGRSPSWCSSLYSHKLLRCNALQQPRRSLPPPPAYYARGV